MGIFDFIKRDKTDDTGMDLPPVPKLDDTSLPPLPAEIPADVPPSPIRTTIAHPKAEVPPPVMPEKPEMIEPMQDIPSPDDAMFMTPEDTTAEDEIHAKVKAVHDHAFPEMPHEDIVPEKIPPLEGIPAPPEDYRPKPTRTVKSPEPFRPIERHEMPIIEEIPIEHHTYPEPEQRISKKPHGPLFIRTDKFRSAIDNIEQIKAVFSEEDNIFFSISEVKNSQDQRYEAFRQGLEDIQRKLLFIDRALFEQR